MTHCVLIRHLCHAIRASPHIPLKVLKQKSSCFHRNVFWRSIHVRESSVRSRSDFVRSRWDRLKADPQSVFESLCVQEDSDELKDVLTALANSSRGSGGEFIPRNIVTTFCVWYRNLPFHQRTRVLTELASLNTNHDDVQRCLSRYADTRTDDSTELETYERLERQLRQHLTPLHEDVLKLILAMDPNGMKFVIDLREDVLNALKESHDARLRYLDGNMKAMLRNWFGSGFLNLVRVTWDSPARLLEKIGAYEKVHPTRRVSDMKVRLGNGRRCFAFFHPSLPDEPLVFVHVALVPKIAHSLRYIHEKTDVPNCEESAHAAIFWSISNTQPGLQGVDLGHLLIKHVVNRLQSEWPGGLPPSFQFSTLSPIPGFSKWLEYKLTTSRNNTSREDDKFAERVEDIFSDDEIQSMTEFWNCDVAEISHNVNSCLQQSPRDVDSDLLGLLESPFKRLAARYVVREKKRARALCPVANFHIRNGAIVERINWMADRSTKGLSQSYGLMVNYRYDLDRLEKNHEAYTLSGAIPVSDDVGRLI